MLVKFAPLIIAAATIAAACTSGEDSRGRLEAQAGIEAEVVTLQGVPDAQEAALADGVVTFEEYERAAFEYKGCVEESGYNFAAFGFSTDSGLYEWLVNTEADACYDPLFGQIDRAWQARVWAEQTNAREARRLRLVACLRAEGLPVDEAARLNEVLIFAGQNGFDSLECR